MNKCGYNAYKLNSLHYPVFPFQRKKILESYKINTILDIGANTGQFAQMIRKIGYTKKILSFEPLSSAFALLEKNAKKDLQWDVFNFALGSKEEKRVINIALNSVSSSFLDIMPSHLKAAAGSQYLGSETVNIKPLDAIYHNLLKQKNNIYIKIDAQGFEAEIIKGAEKSLNYISTIEMEMSLVPLYSGETLFNELYASMIKKGYRLIFVEPAFASPHTGELLQINGIFHRFSQKK